MYVKLNNTLNRQRIRKDFVDAWVRLMHEIGSAANCPRCAGRAFVDLSDAPSDWTVAADRSYSRRIVLQCQKCELVMIEDYWDWREESLPDGAHQKAVLHLVEPEENRDV